MLSADDRVVAALRRHDRDRFLATLFAPPERRPALWALLAFNLEIARVREVASQPLIGQIRLAWWREMIAEAFAGGPVRRHEVATPLAEAIRTHRIRRERLDALVDGRERDLDPAPPQTMAELVLYAEATSSRLVEAEMDVLGAEHAAARPAGIAWALVGLLRAVPFHAAGRRSWIPAETGLGEAERFGPSPAMARAAKAVAQIAETHLAEARTFRGSLPAAALPAFLTLRVAGRYLRVLKAVGYDPWSVAVSRPDPWAALRMGSGALLRRF